MRQGQQRSRCDWAGGTPPSLLPRCLLPGVRRFTCKNSLPPPLFLSSVFTVSPLLLHHASSPSPLASLLLSLLSLLPYLTPHTPPPPPAPCSCPSMSLIILHCFTCTVVRHRQSELCTHTHMHAQTCTHTRTYTHEEARTNVRHTRTGRHTPTTSGSPPLFPLPFLLSHTSPLQTRNILQPLVRQLVVKRHC